MNCAYSLAMSAYADANCSLARSLEVVGDRWTLLIVRDAFYGVRRFGDFVTQLQIPRAVLTARLKLLVEHGVLSRERGPGGTVEYQLTERGVELWPALRALMAWGDAHCSPNGVRRVTRHDADGGTLDADGRCSICHGVVPVTQIRIEPGPGYDPSRRPRDPVSQLMGGSRRLLEPIR